MSDVDGVFDDAYNYSIESWPGMGEGVTSSTLRCPDHGGIRDWYDADPTVGELVDAMNEHRRTHHGTK